MILLTLTLRVSIKYNTQIEINAIGYAFGNLNSKIRILNIRNYFAIPVIFYFIFI